MQFKGIIDHEADGSALTKETGFTVLKGGHRKCKPTAFGWKVLVLVEWQDDTTTWMDLKDVKKASPIELAKYVVANKINDKPAFV